MPIISVGDIDLHYRMDGPETGPVLVLVNSIATDLIIWDDVVAALQDDFRILRYDARGQGGTAATDAPYSLGLLGTDLVALLDALGFDRANVCGLSLGAMVGMWVATHHPERVDRLILCNTAAQVGPPDSWDARAAAVRDRGMEAIRPAVLERWLSPEFCHGDAARTQRVLEMALRASPMGYIGACAAIRDMDQRESIQMIGAPTLVVASSADAATPIAQARDIAAAIPGAILVELPGGHLSHVEQPARLADAIRGFLLAP